jgi:hypothetical protein
MVLLMCGWHPSSLGVDQVRAWRFWRRGRRFIYTKISRRSPPRSPGLRSLGHGQACPQWMRRPGRRPIGLPVNSIPAVPVRK